MCHTISFLILGTTFLEGGAAEMLVPQIDGEGWQVAGDPDLGALTDPKQQPVDFAVWPAADGTWQLWSCIRHTRCGGKTRLFHRWEGQQITDRDWTPKGIAMQADARFGETPGGLQAPHVIRHEGVYHMFYGDWTHVCHATSRDGKTFERVVDAQGRTGLFGEGADANARDPMLLRVGDLFHGYYTAFPGQKGSVFCRTSKDLAAWSEVKIVSAGGSAGTGPFSHECPHAVYLAEAALYYLFHTQRYGQDAQTSVYASKDPLNFGVDDDAFLVCRLPIAAPELVLHEGNWYIASLLPSLKGIRIARLRWPARANGAFRVKEAE